MRVIHLLIEIVLGTICGWVGYITVKAVTFGKVELEWRDSPESIMTECIGGGVLWALATLIWLLIG